MAIRIRRREFIVTLGSAAVARPLITRAQQAAMPVVGFLSALGPGELTFIMPAFREGLSGVGFVESRNVTMEYRWAEGDYQRLPDLAADLVNRKVAVIAVMSGTAAVLAAKAATTTIPIVFAIGGDPIAPGLVASLNHPAGNVTGVSFYNSPVVTKRLELARDLASGESTIAVLVNPNNPPSAAEGNVVREAAAAAGQPLLIFSASSQRQIDDAFTAIKQQRVGALIISADPFFFSERVKLIVLMARYAIPTIFANREQAEAGGLISYGASRANAYRQAGTYVGRVLNGEKPAELPVILSAKFELVVNSKTAQSLGIVIPTSVIARADEMIE
jgi:putative ABC transport system substrate-binding protein